MSLPEWQSKSFIVGKLGSGYQFGLELCAGDQFEIHGPFENANEAMAYGTRLMRTYRDYESCKVIKIESPGVGYSYSRETGWSNKS